MFGILGFNADKARKIRDNKQWYIRYEQWRANRKELKLNLNIIREQFANGMTKASLFYLKNEYHNTSILNLFTNVNFVYSDVQWVIKEIEKRGFVVEHVCKTTYKISLPEVERLAPPVNDPEDIDKVREKYANVDAKNN